MSNFVLTPLSEIELRRFFDDDALRVIDFFLRSVIIY